MALSTTRAAARRRHLVDTAQQLIRERGDAGFSMALLAARAGVSAATPYNLLRSKAEILRLVVRDDLARFIGELSDRPGATPLADLLAAIDQLVVHYESDRPFYTAVYLAVFSPAAPEVRGIVSAESWDWWNRLVEAAIASGEITGVVRTPLLTDVLLRMIGAVTQTWLVQRWTPARFAAEMSLSVRLVLATMCAPAPQTAMLRAIAALQGAIEAQRRDEGHIPRADG